MISSNEIVVLDEELMRTETEAVRARKELESKFEEEKKNLSQTMEGKGKRIDHLLQENDLLEEEFRRGDEFKNFFSKHGKVSLVGVKVMRFVLNLFCAKPVIETSLSLKGKNAAMVLCWLLGNGCLFAWNDK
ncbi:hypothetical protein Syun_006803 [Stephania yunnanensis]|uniref:Uncharacterized protein n=1 Tax=Stephania yunnanensis TaxID=152371 RepID=A0AAP0PXW4_9MAGN